MPPEVLGGGVCCVICWALIAIGYNLRIFIEWSRKKAEEKDISCD